MSSITAAELQVERGRAPLLATYAVIVGFLPLLRPGVLHVGSQPVVVTDAAVVTLYGLTLGYWVTGRLKLKFDTLFLGSVGYIVLLALSLLVAGRLFTRDAIKLAAFSAFVLLPWLSCQVLTAKVDFIWVARAWTGGLLLATGIGAVSIVAFYLDREGIGQLLQCGYGGIRSGNYPRLCRPFPTPNAFMNYLITATPLAMTIAFTMLRVPFAWLALVVVTAVATLTLSAGLGGFAIACAIVLVTDRRRRGVRRGALDYLIVGGASIGAIFFFASMVATISPKGTGHISFGSHDLKLMDGMRPSIWAGVLPTISEHPWTGIGYGALVSETADPRAFMTPDKIETLTGPVKPHRLEAHNVWLNVLGQAGVLGLFGFAALLTLLTRGWVWNRQERQHEWAQPLRIACLASFVGAFLYHGIFGAVEESRHLWALLGFAAALVVGSRERSEASESNI